MSGLDTMECTLCKMRQPLSAFEFRSDSQTYRKTCRVCRRRQRLRTHIPEERLAKIREADKLKARRRRKLKGELINEARRVAYAKTKDKVLARNKQWRKANWDLVAQQRKESGSARRSIKKWYHTKGKYNLQFVLAERLRRRLRRALANGRNSQPKKLLSALALVGCSIPELIHHIERQFTDGMSWGNYGEWHIDHIRPCNAYDLTTESEQKKCFHFTNLQPLWGRENILKGDKIQYA